MMSKKKKADLTVLCAILVAAFASGVLYACTPTQRAIVHTVVDLVDAVCGDSDDVDACLGKMQTRRASMRAAAAGSASVGAADAGVSTP